MPLASAAVVTPAPPTVEAVFREQGAFVVRTVRRLGAPAADVEDLAQQVFVVLHTRPEMLAQGAPVRSLLFGIVRRIVSDHRRRLRPALEVSHELLSVPASQERRVAQSQARELLDVALDALDADKREVFVLYELESLAMREVAEIVGVPLQTAYTRLHAARAAVRLTLRGKDLP